MKIISSFVDYYDNVSHQYRDDSILFLREPRRENIKLDRTSRLPIWHETVISSVRGELNFSVIGFCGHLYPILILNIKDAQFKIIDSHYIYDIDTYETIMQKYGFRLPERHRFSWRLDSFNAAKKNVSDFFQQEGFGPILKKEFERLRVATFLLTHSSSSNHVLTINPLLKTYEFFRIKDPFTAHQELSMYVGGVLNQPEREMVHITDHDKVHKHGFDKWSFRKLPTKKK